MNRQVYREILRRLGVETPEGEPKLGLRLDQWDLEGLASIPPLPRSPVPQLRRAYRRAFDLTVVEADNQRVDRAEALALRQSALKLYDEVGPLFADAIFADELRRFRMDTGRCGLCGGLGHAHEAERS